MNITPTNIPYKFILFSLLLSAVVFTVENINHRFQLNDFKVYYYAAEAFVQGKQVYGTPFGLVTGYYKYSPFALFFFLPYTILPYYAANVIHFALVSGGFVTAVIVTRKIVTTYLLPFKIKNENLLLAVVNICVLLHLVRELKLGNINVLLVLLLSCSLLLLLKNRQVAAGILLGLAIMFKPYMLVLALPLLLHKKIKVLLFVTATLIISVIVPVIIFGPAKSIEMHKQWIGAMLAHSSYLHSNHTIQSLVRNNIWQALPSLSEYFIIVLVLGVYIFLFWFYKRNEGLYKSNADNDKQLILEYFTLLAIIPNILITDTEQFLFSLPIIIILISYLWVAKKNYFMTGLATLLIILYGINSSDLLGNDLSALLEGHGFLGLSNLCIIGLCLYTHFKDKRLKISL